MKPSIKKYDPGLHKKARPAEMAVLRFLNINPELFGKSIHCGDTNYKKDGFSRKFDYEVEWRPGHWPSWKKEFPYKTVSIPGRKLPNIRPHTLYFVVRKDIKRTLMIMGSVIINGRRVIKNTKCTDHELFIYVPKELGVYFDLVN